MRRRLGLGALALLSVVAIGCDRVGYIAVTNETDARWIIIHLPQGAMPYRSVVIEPREEGTLVQSISFEAMADEVLLLTTDCRLADTARVSGGSATLTIRIEDRIPHQVPASANSGASPR